MIAEFNCSFGNYPSRIVIREELPSIGEILRDFSTDAKERDVKERNVKEWDIPALIVCDSNTEHMARKLLSNEGGRKISLLSLESGEETKTWESVEIILRSGRSAGLGRDGLFIGVGGGVIGDLTAFAASIYMRGTRLCLVSTTLLGMVDAGIGGKTGIDLLGLKNLAGTFYPAGLVILPLEALDTLPEREWKSGMAELLKTAVIDSDGFFNMAAELALLDKLDKESRTSPAYRLLLKECIGRAAACKCRIVEADPRETGVERAKLNFGHSFGHALESAAGLGAISHGEAAAWGMVRACELGLALGITPAVRAKSIAAAIAAYGYETRAPHPLAKTQDILDAMKSDKKQTAGNSRFVVPGTEGVQIIPAEGSHGPVKENLLRKILSGECLI